MHIDNGDPLVWMFLITAIIVSVAGAGFLISVIPFLHQQLGA